MSSVNVSIFRKLYVSARPWSFPASVMPVVLGTALGVFYGGADFKPVLFAMALVAMMLLHSGSNVLNDVCDYRNGLDTQVTDVSGGIVRGYFSELEGIILALLMMCAGCGIGLVIVYFVGLPILYIGLVGVFIGGFYTVAPIALKHHAMGDFAVFMDFGILGSLGAWTVQTGSMAFMPALWALPSAMLVAGILHANNWRDISSDTKRRVNTMAAILGDVGSAYYYALLVFGPYLFVILTVILTHILQTTYVMPYTCLLVLLALPLSIRLFGRGLRRKTSENPMDFILLDKGTAELNMLFGTLYVVSLVAGRLI